MGNVEASPAPDELNNNNTGGRSDGGSSSSSSRPECDCRLCCHEEADPDPLGSKVRR